MNDFVSGLLIGVLLAGLFIACLVNTGTNSVWERESAGHGYAHFEPNGSWHWNNETGNTP